MAKSQLCDKQICLLSFQFQGTEKQVWTSVGTPFFDGYT